MPLNLFFQTESSWGRKDEIMLGEGEGEGRGEKEEEMEEEEGMEEEEEGGGGGERGRRRKKSSKNFLQFISLSQPLNYVCGTFRRWQCFHCPKSGIFSE